MNISDIIKEIREGLDELCIADHCDPEFMKLNAIRFMENYRIMRVLEKALAEYES